MKNRDKVSSLSKHQRAPIKPAPTFPSSCCGWGWGWTSSRRDTFLCCATTDIILKIVWNSDGSENRRLSRNCVNYSKSSAGFKKLLSPLSFTCNMNRFTDFYGCPNFTEFWNTRLQFGFKVQRRTRTHTHKTHSAILRARTLCNTHDYTGCNTISYCNLRLVVLTPMCFCH